MGPTGGPAGADPPAQAAGGPAVPQAEAQGAPRTKPAPALLAEHAHLGLAELRAYRTALQDEEGTVSYWRRILQARLDVVRAGSDAGPDSGGTKALEISQLRGVLSQERVGSGRTALLSIVPRDDIPPLPDLAELWERLVAPGDEPGRALLEADLAAGEARLSLYRQALLTRLNEATGELVARYRAQPVLCLSALPLPGPRAEQKRTSRHAVAPGTSRPADGA